jgi:hypothetical protein
MPLLTELIVSILCSYKDFAPTELVIRSDRDLAGVFQQPPDYTLSSPEMLRGKTLPTSPHLPFSYVGQVALH